LDIIAVAAKPYRWFRISVGGDATDCNHITPEEHMKSFLAGLGLGVGLGILFAPMSGEETRNNLADRANDLADQARDTIEQGRERVRSGLSAVRNATGVQGQEQRPTGTQGGV
jgi:YtxH-like protein